MTEPVAEPIEQKTSRKRSAVFYPLVILGVLVGIFLIVFLIAVVVGLVLGEHDAVANWVAIFRDLLLIVLAMEGMVMGVALIVLVIQLAALVNVLQNEIKPIVDSANQTVTTVRGTAEFVSQNVVEPVVKFSSAAVGLSALLRELLRLRRSVRRAMRPDNKGE